jgi:hypothetical protein
MKITEDFGKRVETLEDVSLELLEKAGTFKPDFKDAATTAADANTMAKYAFLLGFAVDISGAADPRERMSKWIRILNSAGLSKEAMEWIEGWMSTLVHLSEEFDETPKN